MSDDENEKPTPEEIEAWEKRLYALKKSQFGEVMLELEAVKDHPRTITLVTHGFLELMISVMIDATCKQAKKINSDRRGFPHSTKVLILNEMGVLSDHHTKLLDWFRNLRNDFAHKWHFKLTKDRLEAVHADSTFHDPKNFPLLCRGILFDLYAMHEGIIGPAFVPDEFKEAAEQEKVIVVTEPGPKYVIPLKSDPAKITRRANDDDISKMMKAMVERERQKKAAEAKAEQPKPDEPKT
jgi:hypothetical protein